MSLSGFENSHPALACSCYLLLWIVFSAALLWPFSRKRVLGRLPVCLTVVILFLADAAGLLPLAMPRLFEHFLGHSLQAISTIRESGGTLLSEPWLERWREASDKVFDWVAICGFWWAIVNLCRRRAWITNTIAAVWVAFWWLVAHIVARPL